jgi:hypothetical protein
MYPDSILSPSGLLGRSKDHSSTPDGTNLRHDALSQ